MECYFLLETPELYEALKLLFLLGVIGIPYLSGAVIPPIITPKFAAGPGAFGAKLF